MEKSKLLIEKKRSIFIKKKLFSQKNILLFTNILAFVFLIIGRFLYIKSLKGCDGDEFICVINNDLKYILDDIYYCIHSALYFLFFLIFFHLKLCNKWQLLIFILIILQLILKIINLVEKMCQFEKVII